MKRQLARNHNGATVVAHEGQCVVCDRELKAKYKEKILCSYCAKTWTVVEREPEKPLAKSLRWEMSPFVEGFASPLD